MDRAKLPSIRSMIHPQPDRVKYLLVYDDRCAIHPRHHSSLGSVVYSLVYDGGVVRDLLSVVVLLGTKTFLPSGYMYTCTVLYQAVLRTSRLCVCRHSVVLL